MSFRRQLNNSHKGSFASHLCTLSLLLLCVALSPSRDLAAPVGSPVVSLSATSLAFASEAIGNTTGAQAVILSNPGSAALSIGSIAITGMSINDFVQSNTCGNSVPAGSACSITVTFTPTAAGARYAGVVLNDNAAGNPQTVTLSGTGAAVPAAILSAGSLAFGGEAIGNAAAAQFISLWNPGSEALSISSIAIAGMSINDFAQTNTCGSSLPAGSTCTLRVSFTPTATGARYAGVTLNDNAAGSPQTVTLTGTGAAVPAATLLTSNLAFASEPIGNPTPPQLINLWNPGSAALSFSSIAITGISINDFALTNTCGNSLPAGSICTISVIFTPTASGARYAAVTLTDNAPGSPQTVPLTGTGASGNSTVGLSASSLAFGTQPVGTTSTSQTITMANYGSAALSITSIGLAGANAADYSQANNCNSSLAPGGNCTIVILFTPSAVGTRAGQLDIFDNASGSPQTVGLSGTGAHDVILSWTASPSTGIAGYNVYRGTTSNGESATPLNSSPVTGVSYVDENVQAGQTYYYVVTTVGSNGVTQSGDSAEAFTTLPSP